VEQVVTYSHRDVTKANADIVEKMTRGEINWVTITSNAIASALISLYGQALHQTKLASLSPGITKTLKDAGLTTAAEACEATMASLIDAIHQAQLQPS